MSTWIAFFRGINVGGRHSLPMKELVSLFEAQGCTDIKTYIQSGNVVFRHAGVDVTQLAEDIGRAILASHGFQPRILILSKNDLEQAVVANPFPHAADDPKTLHLYFLSELPPSPDLDAITGIQADNESFSLLCKVFYLHAPDGIGRSKLAGKVEKLICVDATARNCRTVNKVLELTCR